MTLVYLAHPLPDRQYVRDVLEPKIESETTLDLINPFYDTRYEREDVTAIDEGRLSSSSMNLNPEKIVLGDLAMVANAQAILAIVSPNISVGTFMELFYATYVLHHPGFIICLEGVPERLSQHPWLRYMTKEHIFMNADDFISWVNSDFVRPDLTDVEIA